MNFTNITTYFDLPLMKYLQGSDSVFLDGFIHIMTSPLTWIPLYVILLFIIVKNHDTMKQIGLVLTFALLTFAISDYVVDVFIKPHFMRFRPTQDPLLKYTIDVVMNYRGGLYGFFSAHASNTVSIAVFFSLLMRSGVMTSTMLLWSMLNCYTRIYLGVHYPSDVLVGILWGIIVGCSMYFIYVYTARKSNSRYMLISDKYTSTGYLHTDMYLVGITFMLLIYYGIIRSFLFF